MTETVISVGLLGTQASKAAATKLAAWVAQRCGAERVGTSVISRPARSDHVHSRGCGPVTRGPAVVSTMLGAGAVAGAPTYTPSAETQNSPTVAPSSAG